LEDIHLNAKKAGLAATNSSGGIKFHDEIAQISKRVEVEDRMIR